MRHKAKVDDNQRDIVNALRSIGCSVISLAAVGNGCPDLLVGFRGNNFLLEVKDGNKSPSRRKLTPDQQKFFATWQGYRSVVKSAEEAVQEVVG